MNKRILNLDDETVNRVILVVRQPAFGAYLSMMLVHFDKYILKACLTRSLA